MRNSVILGQAVPVYGDLSENFDPHAPRVKATRGRWN